MGMTEGLSFEPVDSDFEDEMEVMQGIPVNEAILQANQAQQIEEQNTIPWSNTDKVLTIEEQNQLLLEAKVKAVKESGIPQSWIDYSLEQIKGKPNEVAVRELENVLRNWENQQIGEEG